MHVLRKEPVEDCPAALTSFSHVVAIQQLLRGEPLYRLAVSLLNPRLYNLQEAKRIAAAAVALITHATSEVLTADVAQVKRLRNLVFRYRVSIRILILESFQAFPGRLEQSIVIRNLHERAFLQRLLTLSVLK